MKAIGGYFELADRECGIFPHSDGILLNTGRTALEYILRNIPEIKGIWIPYYTCEVVLEPIKKLNIPYFFYHININFEIAENFELEDGQYIIVNNYYGIKDAYIKTLYQSYGNRLIVDCAQAFFAEPISNTMSFYSCRKFVGVADGGVAYGVSDNLYYSYAVDDSSDHNSHLMIRRNHGAEAGFHDYQINERKLDNQPIRRMSNETKDILNHIDYKRIISSRRNNFEYLHKALCDLNMLKIPSFDSFVCPMVYPFYSEDIDLKKHLIQNKIFVATYWVNVLEWCKSNDLEYEFTTHIVPLPIDQRYGIEDLDRIVKVITSWK